MGDKVADEAVRRELARTIKRKEGRIQSLERLEQDFLAQAATITDKRQAVVAEIASLTKHLDSVGGPVVKTTRTGAKTPDATAQDQGPKAQGRKPEGQKGDN